MENIGKESLEWHYKMKGKISVEARCTVKNRRELSIAYTPGVAEPCLEIQRHPERSFELTRRWNSVAVITDGTAVLGLGDIGPEAGMPVMEGKCVLFREFAGIDAYPLCIRSKDVDEIVRTIYLISGSFGGINLEDIAAPRCFEIEDRLKEICDIPIFHDDQHGTAVVVGAALLNALKIVGKDISSIRIVISGAGAAGISICRLLMRLGAKDITLVGRKGIIVPDLEGITEPQREMAKITNPDRRRGGLADAVSGADVFIGVSAPGILKPESIKTMNPDPIVFPMANPVPEIMPDLALEAGARIVGTGRSDFPNQINNVLAFPGIFRGALDCRASAINEEMKIAAARALAAAVSEDKLCGTNILPAPFEEGIADKVAAAVTEAARASGVARV